MEATLAAPGPLDVSRTLARFHLWGEDPANRLADGVFRRAVRGQGRWHGYELRWAGGPRARGAGGAPPGRPPGGGGGAGARRAGATALRAQAHADAAAARDARGGRVRAAGEPQVRL